MSLVLCVREMLNYITVLFYGSSPTAPEVVNYEPLGLEADMW